MGSHKGREGQGARTAFRKAPQASPPETRFTVEVNDFLERFKLLELGLAIIWEAFSLRTIRKRLAKTSTSTFDSSNIVITSRAVRFVSNS